MKKLFSRFFILLVISGTLTNVVSSASRAYEVGLIDEVRVLTEYKESKDAQEKINTLRTKMQNLLVELNDELDKASKDKKVTEAQKAQKQKDAEKRLIDEKTKAEDVANALREQIESKVKQAINEEATAQKLDLILSSEASFYGGKDITDSVVKRLNSKTAK
ncbi:MAG: OmpH family outer membrane protein [Candidatus Caenarcaniphilales bacterium]|nr:OmpH family outer membrane protein [Candidatus Caenarcaniphilales bacterium]